MNIVILMYHPSGLTNWVCKLAPYMKGHNMTVLHIAKLHNVEPINIPGVRLIDISGFPAQKAEDLLIDLKPDVFVFMSFRSIMELTYNRLCTKIGIKKVYVEHGLFSRDTLKFRTKKLKKEFSLMFKRQASFLYTHLDFIFNNKNKLDEIRLFYNVYCKGKFNLVPYEHYYIFSRRSFDNYSKLFPMNETQNVTYVGYPIFNDEAQKKVAEVINGGGILYVHQPLIFDGLANITYDEEKEWLVEISKRLCRYSRFTILLHPRGDLDAYKKRFRDTNIDIIKSPNNYKLFADKDLIIGHYSTALLYGLYFDKPTIVLDYPTTINDPLFAELFTYISDIKLIDRVEVSTDISKKEYMVGSHNTFEHIAKVLINDYNSQNEK